MINELDRRAKKTRRSIQHALMKLLQEKDITKIKVKDLCEVADINRSTFYLHYYDLFHILEDIESDACNDVMNIFKTYNYRILTENPYPLFKSLTNLLLQSKDFHAFIIGSPAASQFLSKVKKTFRNKVIEQFKIDYPQSNTDSLFYGITLVTSGVIDVYGEWIKRQMPIPIEELCTIASKLVAEGISSIVQY